MHCGKNNLKMDESPEEIAEKTIELAKSFKSTTNKVVILSITHCRDKVTDKGYKVNNIVEIFTKENVSFKFMQKKYLDARKPIGKDDIHLYNFGITQIEKKISNF